MKKFYVLFISIFLTVNLMAQTNDVGITEIVEPVQYLCIGTTAVIKVKIKNFGTQTQTSIPLTYRSSSITQLLEIWTGVLLAGDSVIYTFQNQLVVPWGSSIGLWVYTELLNDLNLHNDTCGKALGLRSVNGPNNINGPINVNNGSIVSYSAGLIWFGNVTNLYWSYTPSNGVSINAFDTTAILSFGASATSGVLSVYGYDSISHCSGPITTLNITISNGIIETSNTSFLLSQNSPNPASAYTNIEYHVTTATNVKFELINLLGDKIMAKSIKAISGKNNFVLDVSALPNGIYYYSMEYIGKKQFKKLIVSK
jgi:hypothetical protein